MHNYRAYVLAPGDRIVRAEVLPCPDDQTAIAVARQLVDGHEVEVWHRSRKIARLGSDAVVVKAKKGDRSTDSRPRETQIEMAERHVQEGEDLVDRQERLVAGAEGDARVTWVTTETLKILRVTLQRHRDRLGQLRDDRAKARKA